MVGRTRMDADAHALAVPPFMLVGWLLMLAIAWRPELSNWRVTTEISDLWGCGDRKFSRRMKLFLISWSCWRIFDKSYLIPEFMRWKSVAAGWMGPFVIFSGLSLLQSHKERKMLGYVPEAVCSTQKPSASGAYSRAAPPFIGWRVHAVFYSSSSI